MGQNSRMTYGMTQNLVSAALTKGTTSTYTTTVTTAGCINGKFVTTLAAQTNTASPTTDAVTGLPFVALGINKATVLVYGQTAAGAIQLAQGSIEDTLPGVTTTVGPFIRAPQFPALPDDYLPLAYLLVRTAPSASSWTAGTSSWTATGVTASAVVNVSTLPDRPQTS
ncbi:MAG: hypothetical protein V4772_08630 [Pseudomonadota bacterium]